jgi:hypothetical protein
MGYGKAHGEDQWWFDLEDVDGVVQVPRKYSGKHLWAADE